MAGVGKDNSKPSEKQNGRHVGMPIICHLFIFRQRLGTGLVPIRACCATSIGALWVASSPPRVRSSAFLGLPMQWDGWQTAIPNSGLLYES